MPNRPSVDDPAGLEAREPSLISCASLVASSRETPPVPETRLELVSPCERRILSPLRIPFRHSGNLSLYRRLLYVLTPERRRLGVRYFAGAHRETDSAQFI